MHPKMAMFKARWPDVALTTEVLMDIGLSMPVVEEAYAYRSLRTVAWVGTISKTRSLRQQRLQNRLLLPVAEKPCRIVKLCRRDRR